MKYIETTISNKIEIEEKYKHFINKKIQFSTKEGKTGAGTCTFIGYNPSFKSWELQINIDRTPFTNVIPESIKLM